MTKRWMLALAVGLPLYAAHAQIGTPIGGAPAGGASSSTAGAGNKSGQPTTGGKRGSGSDKDAEGKASGARQGGVGASGIGWSTPSSPSQKGSSATITSGFGRSGMPATTTGF